jgi:hypothetical protein
VKAQLAVLPAAPSAPAAAGDGPAPLPVAVAATPLSSG